MSITTTIEFTNTLEHVFDPSVIEIAGGVGKLKSQVSPNEVLFSNFDTDNNLVSKRGAKSIVLSGDENTGQVAGGILDFPNQDGSLGSLLNLTDITDDFAFRCKCISNVGTMSTNRDILLIKSNVDSSHVRFYLQNQGGGITRLRREIKNSSGGTQHEGIVATMNLATNPIFNIAISFDADTLMATYFNGELWVNVGGVTSDYSDCDIIFGSEDAAYCSYDDVQLFKSFEITEDFAFPFPEATTYVKTPEVVQTPVPLALDSWTFFGSTIIELEGSEVRHQIIRNSVSRYFYNTGLSLWEVVDAGGDQFAQSNTEAEILSNLGTFPVVLGFSTTIEMYTFLKASPDGYTTPCIDNFVFKYTKHFKQDEIGKCAVEGVLVDNSGDPVVGAIVSVNSKDHLNQNVMVAPLAMATTDAFGRWVMNVVETTTTETTVDFKFTYLENGKDKSKSYKGLTIPNQASCKFSELFA